MAVVLGEQDVLAITIPEAIASITSLIVDINRKNRTMVEYYIYPKPTPSQIEAFQPRLQVLYARLESLAALNLPNLTLVVDDAPWLMAFYLLPVLDQLLNAVHGIQDLFIKHYDRTLEQRKPYDMIYTTLDYRERQLKNFQDDHLRNPQRRTADALNPATRTGPDIGFCRFAVAFVNNRDHGKLSQVLPEDLTADEKDRLRNHSGAYLSWDCPGCAFKLKYHVASSVAAHILATDDVRSHKSSPEVEYRPSWLVKCHLYQTKPSWNTNTRTSGARRLTISTGDGQQRMRNVQRRSEARSPRLSNSFFFGVPRRTRSMPTEEIFEPQSAVQTRHVHARYGCPFCFVRGKEGNSIACQDGRDLAEHIAARHNLGGQPSALVLEKYMVGLNGRCAENVRRWDLNIKNSDTRQY